LNSSSDVEAALVGAYAQLGSNYVYGGNSQVDQELLGNANTLNWAGTYQEMTQIYNKAIPVNNTFIASTWNETYRVINTANNVLASIDKVEEVRRDEVEGEAKFIRALAYYNLITVFAKSYNDGSPSSNPGVPIVLDPTREINEESQVPRASVEEVYGQIIADLIDAKAKCNDNTDAFFATTYSASAMLARVYLQKGDYPNALAEADNVIQNGGFELTDTYAASFPGDGNAPASRSNTKEEIFSIQVTETSGVNDFNTYFSTSGRGDIDINQSFYDEFDATDERGQFFYDVSGFLFTYKFESLYSNITVLRLAEMYLIRAESNFRLGTAVGATPVEDINEIRDRSGAPTVSTVSLDDIIKERRHELAFEGFAINDAKRLEMNVGALPWTSPKLIYPIPQREMFVNKNLVQNEGY
ncbi:MAG TPA: RagB/SusD family nutrient uptake outer membrane protein, partial [Flavitalea sp.]|nr:RagB/SusD family nutrient uptake outer membrane protein [Flavitalea sp.]